MSRTKHHTGLAGTYATAAELCRREYEVALAVANRPGFDMFCTSPAGRPFKIQVKSATAPNFVPVQRAWLEASPDDFLFLIVALVPRDESQWRFFVLTQPECVALWQSVPKTKASGEPYAAGWEGFAWGAIQPHEGCWSKLPP